MINFPVYCFLKMADDDSRDAKTLSVDATFSSFEEFKTSLDLLKEKSFTCFECSTAKQEKIIIKKEPMVKT